ncbi:helix-turn-helix domain-containing protein [Flammeovirga aprica]|uniref:Helix-turn-helix transcriptional regulator n=1 Tax=Flammeovirga aprica JL-4 TaxID=694437 RepID=A0A7X9X9Y3_9BACT|nr:helix-turn-helix transcriptional regulator [Flammeovirga aprica]NME69134.1 helix-turn-helix transcriptional regulator [Flammeovirga aprica JL-4]
MYTNTIHDYNQHKQWLKDFFEGEFIHPNLLKVDNDKGEGFIFFYKIHPSIYFIYYNIDAKRDFTIDLDYGNASYFKYFASFFNRNISVKNKEQNTLQSLQSNGFYTCTRKISVVNQVLKGERLQNINIYFSETSITEIDDKDIGEYYINRTHFFNYFDENREMILFKKSLQEINHFSEKLKAKILPVKMQELYYLFLRALKRVTIPSCEVSFDENKLGELFQLRNKLIGNWEIKPDFEGLVQKLKGNAEETEALFESVFGYPVATYYSNYKMELIRIAILSKQQSISEIATAFGYTQVQHFSTTFKRKFGASPSEYLQQNG